MPGPDDFDPLQGLDEEDRAYLQDHRKAFARQQAVHKQFNAGDDDRRKAAEEHLKATQVANGVAPAQIAAPASPMPVAVPVASGALSILIAVPEAAGAGGLPSTTEKYAPDWTTMKDIIARYDGTWIVRRHEFPANVPNILGFFAKEGWAAPEESEKQKFEAIVKNGRVFRTDPE